MFLFCQHTIKNLVAFFFWHKVLIGSAWSECDTLTQILSLGAAAPPGTDLQEEMEQKAE